MTQVERENKEAAARARQQSAAAGGGGWFGWMLGSGARQSAQASPDAAARGELSEEEYRKIVQLVSEQEDALAAGESPQSVTEPLAVQGPLASIVSAA